MSNKYAFLLFSFISFSILSLNAQNPSNNTSNKEKSELAKQAIKDLKEGVLIIRLQSKHKKINRLSELSKSKEVDATSKARIKKVLKEEIEERNQLNKEIVEGFSAFYNFSELYFMYDTASLSLKQGTKKGIFLNANLKLDPSINLGDKSFFILRYGTTEQENTSGIEAWVVMDHKLEDMERPFPYYVSVKGIDSFVQFLKQSFGKDNKAERKALKKEMKSRTGIGRIASKLNAKLNVYYKRVSG